MTITEQQWEGTLDALTLREQVEAGGYLVVRHEDRDRRGPLADEQREEWTNAVAALMAAGFTLHRAGRGSA
ncbi:MAG: hypothetical protein ACRD0S_03710, partial [Acidimicrobiales bacterium]